MDKALAAFVRQRAGGRCEYCLLPQEYSSSPFEIEHIIAEQHGGKAVAGNLALACFACNRHKGPNLTGMDPHTGKLARLFHPRRHAWRRHFRWNGPVLVGRTPVGRVTVAVLAINLAHRVAQRSALMDEGVFLQEP
jgi:hypothetical protein